MNENKLSLTEGAHCILIVNHVFTVSIYSPYLNYNHGGLSTVHCSVIAIALLVSEINETEWASRCVANT